MFGKTYQIITLTDSQELQNTTYVQKCNIDNLTKGRKFIFQIKVCLYPGSKDTKKLKNAQKVGSEKICLHDFALCGRLSHPKTRILHQRLRPLGQ